MNAKRLALVTGMAAALSIPALAQNGGQQWTPSEQWRGDEVRDSMMSDAGAVKNINRASRLIGMPVRNDRNQNLGRIQDVVFDWQAGRIAYAVMAIDDFDGEKLLAVPPSAFSFGGSDRNRLVLHVDRAQLERAQALTRGNWPDVERPFAQFGWLGGGDSPLPARDQRVREDRFATEPFYTERDLGDRFEGRATDDYRSGGQSNIRRYDTYDSGMAPGYQGGARMERFENPDRQTQDQRDRGTFRGHIVAVNPEARTMSVKSDSGEVRQFTFAERTNLQLKNNRYPRIIDLKVGFPVSVSFQDDGGSSVAHTVIRTDTPEVR